MATWLFNFPNQSQGLISLPRLAPHQTNKFYHDGRVTYAGSVCVNKKLFLQSTFSFLSTNIRLTLLKQNHNPHHNLHQTTLQTTLHHSKWTLQSKFGHQDYCRSSIIDALTRNFANSASDTAQSTFNSASESLKGTADQASKEGNKRTLCNAPIVLSTPTDVRHRGGQG